MNLLWEDNNKLRYENDGLRARAETAAAELDAIAPRLWAAEVKLALVGAEINKKLGLRHKIEFYANPNNWNTHRRCLKTGMVGVSKSKCGMYKNGMAKSALDNLSRIDAILQGQPKVLAVTDNVTIHTDAAGLTYLVVYAKPGDIIRESITPRVIVLAGNADQKEGK